MRKPRLTEKVRRGLWLIIARSPTLFSAENGGMSLEKEEREAILAAGRYAAAHWETDKKQVWRDDDE